MKTARQFLLFFPNARFLLITSVIVGSLMGILTLFQALYLSQIIADVFLASLSLRHVWPLMLVLLALLFGRALLKGGNVVIANQIAGYVRKETQARLLAHLFELGPAYTREERSGELVNTLIEGTAALAPYFSQYLPQQFLSFLVPAFIVVTICRVDLPSGFILLIMVPVLPFLMSIAGMMAGAETRRHWRTLSLLSAHFLDTLQGLATLKLFGRSQQAEEQVRQTSEQFRETTMRTLRVAFFSSLLLEESATISAAVVAVEVGLRLLLGQFPFQTALLVLLLTPEFFLPLRLLGATYHAGMTGSQALQRMVEILSTPSAWQKKSAFLAQQPASDRRSETGLSVEQVSYAYNELRPAVRQVSFHLAEGQQAALVGPSGAGKSTLASLLLRFIEPDSGQFVFRGKLATEFTPQAWRAQISWVPQHPYLFHATVAENIRLGNSQATREQIVQAARLAHADAFITNLPRAYDTLIGEQGARLSGGEAQRLSIARAFLKDAPLLILDEASSYLDAESEALVQDSLTRLKQGRIVLSIAHRLSTVCDADQIIVLDQGEVVAYGSHHDLVQQRGVYGSLVEAAQRQVGKP